MKTYDPLSEFLRERGCPAHVVRAGLKGLVLTWEKVVAELIFDGYRYGLRDFVNDLDRREILGAAIDRLEAAVPDNLAARVAVADRRFIEHTSPASRCLLEPEELVEKKVDAARHWWYFRLPRRSRGFIVKDLQEAGIVALPDGEEGIAAAVDADAARAARAARDRASAQAPAREGKSTGGIPPAEGG